MKQVTNKKIRFVNKIILVFTPIICEILLVLSTIKINMNCTENMIFTFGMTLLMLLK